ncbi:hypothetical protein TNCV_1177241 [Trichonephila clavipes]|nr:hypothetical protein TNCV_1177241 [Trichonephila clavipes]
MEIPLRTAYGQNGRYGMQPKARQSSRAGATKTRTETCELVEEKQNSWTLRERKENARDFQLTPNHILECPTVVTKLLKMGMVPLRDSLRGTPGTALMLPRIAEAVIKTFGGI